jgi:cell division septal protein FtsQ
MFLKRKQPTPALLVLAQQKSTKNKKMVVWASLCLLATFVLGLGLMMWQLITQLLAAVC